uniref:Uncharacterized protein n=1 Tax=Tupiella akineta TaxID=160070 RepID=Q6UVW5_TUPAK|nr:hypothetical protein PsakpMp01 [Tupiella akineta]AAQ18711.1 hypothetical protein [Tupiella akineta]
MQAMIKDSLPLINIIYYLYPKSRNTAVRTHLWLWANQLVGYIEIGRVRSGIASYCKHLKKN